MPRLMAAVCRHGHARLFSVQLQVVQVAIVSESVIFLSQDPLICHCTDIDGGLVNLNATSLAGGAGTLL